MIEEVNKRNMSLSIDYPKISNLYSFISNLSQWNEVVVVYSRKDEWVKKTGSLDKDDKIYLNDFTKIMQKSSVNLESFFVSWKAEDIWKKVKENIDIDEYDKLKSVFDHFNIRFGKIWPEEEDNLKKIAEKFSKESGEIESGLVIIGKLCGVDKENVIKDIEIRLLLSGSEKEESQGWAYDDRVVLECSGWPFKKINFLIYNIFLHESFHIMLKKNKKLFQEFLDLINENRDIFASIDLKDWSPDILFEEILVSSFLPEGYLGGKLSNIDARKLATEELDNDKNSFTNLRNFCAIELYKLARGYVEEGKVIDRKYLKAVVECGRDFVERMK